MSSPTSFIKGLIDGAKAKLDATRSTGLPADFKVALDLMKQQQALESEMLDLPDGAASADRREEIQRAMTQIFEEQERSKVLKQCGRILCLIADSDDPDMTIATLTEEGLAVLISSGN